MALGWFFFQRKLDSQYNSVINRVFRSLLYSDNGVLNARDWILR
jgi:hypothetical protein